MIRYFNPETLAFEVDEIEGAKTYTDEEINALFRQYRGGKKQIAADSEGNAIIIDRPAEEVALLRLEQLRNKRKPLLEAFDKWEKAVLRGRETDDDTVMEWYRDILNLDETAIKTVPVRVQYYL